jgi:hypothetical protein
VLVPAAWAGAVLATQAWPSWSTGIREQFAGDVVSYEQIARAAPGLPAGPLPQQHAERFPIHWAIGTVADLTRAGLHGAYRTVSVGLLLAIVAAVAFTLRRLELDLRTRFVLTGLIVASAYPVRYLLAAPGMAADALFLLGLATALWALVADEDGVLVAGLLVAALGRQTAVPLAVVAALVLLARRRYRVAVAAALLPTLLYVVLRLVAERFSNGGALGSSSSIGSAIGHPLELASHLGRTALVLAVPAAVAAGAWLRTRVLPASAPLALAAAVVVQPLVLSPDVVAKNEPRLTGLALPALAIALAPPVRAAMLGAAETGGLCVAILLSSFHARYSDVGLAHTWEWAVLVAACAAAVFVTLARVQAKSRVPSGASQVAGTPWRT